MEENAKKQRLLIVLTIAVSILYMVAVIAMAFFLLDPESNSHTMARLSSGGVWNYIVLVTLLIVTILLFVLTFTHMAGARRSSNAIEKERADSLDIIRALSTNYNAVYFMNRHTGDLRFLQLGDRINYYMGSEYREKHDLEWYARAYADKLVYTAGREGFLKEVNSENITEKLKDRDYYIYTYIGDKNGKPNYFQMKAAKVHNDPMQFVIGFADVNEEVRSEEQQKVMLKDALFQAQEANKSKDSFLAGVSHELLTPLNAIMGFSSMIARNSADIVASGQASHIEAMADQMKYMITDMLDASTISNGQYVLHETPFSLREASRHAVSAISIGAVPRHIHIAESYHVVHDRVVTDEDKYIGLIRHLLGNAVEYSEDGGEVFLDLTEIRSFDGMAYFEMTITDHGIGMDEEFLEHAFDPFTRERSSTDSGLKGIGLGLSISKGIVEIMGGTLKMTSHKGHGTKVTIEVGFKIAD